MTNRGLLVKNNGSSYLVERLSDGELFVCKIKGRFRISGIKTTNPLSVGDIVDFELGDGDDDSVICNILPRRNYIVRRSTNLSKEAHIIASNLDNVFLVVSLCSPSTSYEFVDRFLVTCELYHVPVTILLNKIDLCEEQEMDAFMSVYEKAGYRVLQCSATENIGIDKIKGMMNGKISLFSGNSGVGKSTIINNISPNIDIKMGEVSDHHSKGKHTTTFSQMFKIDNDTYLIDTPGVKGFGLIDVEKEEIARYFPDLFKVSRGCRFNNCTHTHEPGCAVVEAVKEDVISLERYESYLKILEDDEKDKYR
ncbi:MAG: ribosome small subunit-dependent GTPase A [Rikenellaceae bacterium]